jgi:hypothetical protein
MTTIVNLYKSKYDVYIGRRGKGNDGYFGNPVIIGRKCPVCSKIHDDGGATLPCYEQYVRSRINTDPEFRSRVKALKGKTLGCFCKPKPCHGDILKKIIYDLTTHGDYKIC